MDGLAHTTHPLLAHTEQSYWKRTNSMKKDDNTGIMIENNEETYDDMMQDDNSGDITVEIK